MPFLPGAPPFPGLTGTLDHQVENLRNSYASPGPTNPALNAASPTFFKSANPLGLMPPYGALDASSGDQRGGALLMGDSGRQI
jgi:hypothetical protein